MKPLLIRLRVLAIRLWSHVAAGVAVILIVLAFGAGFRLGRPAPEPEVAAAGGTGEADAAPQLYTCSMHPSVRLPDPDAKCPICFMDLIPVVEDGGPGAERRLSFDPSAVAAANIATAEVTRATPTAEIPLFGRVTYDETSVVRITARMPGRLDRLFVNYPGVPVAEGDHLGEIYSPELIGAFEELRLAAADATASTGSAGTIAQTTADTLRAARDRLRLLGVTEAQVEAIESGTFTGDRLTLFAPMGGVVTHLAVREGDYVATGSPIATVANLSRLWLDLEAYESQVGMLRWGQPVTFTITARPGETFTGKISFIEPLVDERTRTSAVRVAVDNTDRRLTPGMYASAVVRPRLAAGGVVLDDALAGRWVSPMHPTVVKDGPGQCDICGMDLVPAESLGVVGDDIDAAMPLVIPHSAVLFTGRRSVVYVTIPDADRPTFEAREVVLGPRAGSRQIVVSGLEEGESVVVRGAFRIDSAMQLAAKPSMMLPGPDSPRTTANRPGDASEADVPMAFVHGLTPVYAAYLDGQEALADDDLAGFNLATSDLRTAIGLVPTSGVFGADLGTWRRVIRGLQAAESFDSIDAARTHFQRATAAMLDLHRRFGRHGAAPLQLAFCPMAFDNAGAEWLQRGETIDNPYFGDAMLRCGEIRRALPPRGTTGGHQHD